jgi:hypothetical protein
MKPQRSDSPRPEKPEPPKKPEVIRLVPEPKLLKEEKVLYIFLFL